MVISFTRSWCWVNCPLKNAIWIANKQCNNTAFVVLRGKGIVSTQYVLSFTHWGFPDLCVVNAKHKKYKKSKWYSCAKAYLLFQGPVWKFSKNWEEERKESNTATSVVVNLNIQMWLFCKVKGYSSFKKKIFVVYLSIDVINEARILNSVVAQGREHGSKVVSLNFPGVESMLWVTLQLKSSC